MRFGFGLGLMRMHLPITGIVPPTTAWKWGTVSSWKWGTASGWKWGH